MALVWTRRDRLVFPDLIAGVRYNLPLYVRTELAGEIFVTDGDGKALPLCEDSLDANPEHCLLWLDVLTTCEAVVYAYHTFALADVAGHSAPRSMKNIEVDRQACDQVLLFAEFFADGKAGVLQRWRPIVEEEFHEHFVEVHPAGMRDGVEPPPCRGAGSVLVLAGQEGRIALRSSVGQRKPSGGLGGRLHLRSHFWDDGSPDSKNWVGAITRFGSGAVGVAPGSNGFYSYVHGHCPTSNYVPPQSKLHSTAKKSWQASSVKRTRGWHLFELCLQEQQRSFSIDGTLVSTEVACHPRNDGEQEVRLVAAGGSAGIWGSVEIICTPLLEGLLLEAGVASDEWHPWRCCDQESGRWFWDGDAMKQQVPETAPATEAHVRDLEILQPDGVFHAGMRVRIVPDKQRLLKSFSAVASQYPPEAAGSGRYHPGMDTMLGRYFDVLEVTHDGMVRLPAACPAGYQQSTWLFPPAVVELGRQELAPTEADCIELSGLPGETKRSRMERAMTAVLELLRLRGTVLPANLHLEHRCRDHSACFIYQFGTRKLHISTRSVDANHLRMLVRNGGGFDNFLAFARRQGNAESARLQKRTSTTGGTPRRSLAKGESRQVIQDEKRSASHGTPRLPALATNSMRG